MQDPGLAVLATGVDPSVPRRFVAEGLHSTWLRPAGLQKLYDAGMISRERGEQFWPRHF